MAELTITTNNHRRELLSGWDLTESEAREFDYLDLSESVNSFFRYRGSVYDLSQFVVLTRWNTIGAPFCHRYSDGSPLADWDGICTDSFFSAIVIRYDREDDESIIVGLALS